MRQNTLEINRIWWNLFQLMSQFFILLPPRAPASRCRRLNWELSNSISKTSHNMSPHSLYLTVRWGFLLATQQYLYLIPPTFHLKLLQAFPLSSQHLADDVCRPTRVSATPLDLAFSQPQQQNANRTQLPQKKLSDVSIRLKKYDVVLSVRIWVEARFEKCKLTD